MDLHYKQEVTVGLLVLSGVALFVWGTMWLSGRGLAQSADVGVVFPEVGNLKRGSPVKVSGVQLGTVHAIEFQEYGKVLVQLDLDERVQPKRDASAELVSVGLVGDQQIAFNPGTAAEPLAAGAVIPGRVAPGFMTIGEELGAKARDVLDSLRVMANQQITRDLSGTLRAVQRLADLYSNPRTGPTAELNRTLLEVQRMGARLDSTLGEFKVSGMLSQTDTLLRSLSRLSTDVRTTAARFDTALARINRGEGSLGRFASDTALYVNAQRTLKSLQEFLDDLRKHPGKLGISFRVF